jgi:leucyl-tRNA synthetase
VTQDRPDHYRFREIETKWQRVWEETGLFRVREEPGRPEIHCLEMFPYPSVGPHGPRAELRVGDASPATSACAEFSVLHPMGWDAFDTPRRNAAIDGGVHPAVDMREHRDHEAQMRPSASRTTGTARSHVRPVPPVGAAHLRRMFERGLAYRKSARGWCPSARRSSPTSRSRPVAAGAATGDPGKLAGWYRKITATRRSARVV